MSIKLFFDFDFFFFFTSEFLRQFYSIKYLRKFEIMHSNNNVKHFYSMSTVAEILMATYLVRFQQTYKYRFEDHLMDPHRSKCELG